MHFRGWHSDFGQGLFLPSFDNCWCPGSFVTNWLTLEVGGTASRPEHVKAWGLHCL